MGLLQKLKSYVFASHPRSSEDARGRLRLLPLEIILLVASQLPDLALLSLSLTCRTYQLLLLPRARLIKLTGEDRASFLQNLEQETPSVYYCHPCSRLHSWKPSDNFTIYQLMRRCTRTLFFMAPYPWPSVPYPFARLIMNRHRYGPPHGFTVDRLECDKKSFGSWSRRGNRLDLKSSARIIDDELFVKRTMSISIRGGEGLDCLDRTQKRSLFICKHLKLCHNRYGFLIPEMKGLATCENSLGSCPKCLTDYSVSITRVEKTRSIYWDIDMATYQQFGACRTPFDWKWMALHKGAGCNTRSLRKGHGPGVVRHRWSRLDEVVLPPGRDFILFNRMNFD